MLRNRALAACSAAALFVTTSVVLAGWAQQAAPADNIITRESLPGILENLGHTVSPSGDTQIISVERDGWTYGFSFFVSQNQKFIWIWTKLADLPDPAALTSARLLRLLEINDTIGPSHFYVTTWEDGSKHLYIGRALDNREVKAVTIRETLEELITSIRNQQEVWDISMWPELSGGSTGGAGGAGGSTGDTGGGGGGTD